MSDVSNGGKVPVRSKRLTRHPADEGSVRDRAVAWLLFWFAALRDGLKAVRLGK